MGNPVTPGAGLDPTPPDAHTPPQHTRVWYADEIVVAAFAFLGFGGAVFLPLRFSNFSHITTSFLLATGIAALTYRYLGGISGASFTVGTLKLTGALGALVGIALLIDHELVSEIAPPPPTPSPYQVYWVSGQVTDESGRAIEPLGAGDVTVEPRHFVSLPKGNFTLEIVSRPDVDRTKTKFPWISVSHKGFAEHVVDLNPDKPADVEIDRSGHNITI